MLIQQTLMTLNAVIKNPGLDIMQLGTKIEEMYGKKSEAVQYMFLEEIDKNSHFKSIFDEIYCVEEKNGLYYYNPALQMTNENNIVQIFIRGYLEDIESKKIKKEIKDHGENICS
jgi:hypothetical protein